MVKSTDLWAIHALSIQCYPLMSIMRFPGFIDTLTTNLQTKVLQRKSGATAMVACGFSAFPEIDMRAYDLQFLTMKAVNVLGDPMLVNRI